MPQGVLAASPDCYYKCRRRPLVVVGGGGGGALPGARAGGCVVCDPAGGVGVADGVDGVGGDAPGGRTVVGGVATGVVGGGADPGPGRGVPVGAGVGPDVGGPGLVVGAGVGRAVQAGFVGVVVQLTGGGCTVDADSVIFTVNLLQQPSSQASLIEIADTLEVMLLALLDE